MHVTRVIHATRPPRFLGSRDCYSAEAVYAVAQARGWTSWPHRSDRSRRARAGERSRLARLSLERGRVGLPDGGLQVPLVLYGIPNHFTRAPTASGNVFDLVARLREAPCSSSASTICCTSMNRACRASVSATARGGAGALGHKRSMTVRAQPPVDRLRRRGHRETGPRLSRLRAATRTRCVVSALPGRSPGRDRDAS